LVQASLAALDELEVLDRIGLVNLLSVDPGAVEMRVEHPAGGPDERASRQVLLVARLLADDHQFGLSRALAHDRLVVEKADRAAATGMDRLVDSRKAPGPVLQHLLPGFDHRAL